MPQNLTNLLLCECGLRAVGLPQADRRRRRGAPELRDAPDLACASMMSPNGLGRRWTFPSLKDSRACRAAQSTAAVKLRRPGWAPLLSARAHTPRTIECRADATWATWVRGLLPRHPIGGMRRSSACICAGSADAAGCFPSRSTIKLAHGMLLATSTPCTRGPAFF